ncbi:MAG TPA: hypothetical protein VKW78_01935 [Terriglobales bacterium]|nr:hypothetical protein [Terriglobales bacterium]
MRANVAVGVLLGASAMAFSLPVWGAAPVLEKIGPAAVWIIPADFSTNAHRACDAQQDETFVNCFVDQMSTAGASPQAANFTRELYRESHGEFGILTGFRRVGPVDIAWVSYPLRANTNNGLLLVNGSPRIVNAEDLKLLDHKGLEQSAQFQDLKARLPKVDVWPGDRDGKTWPESMKSPEGELEFTLSYPLINGCHACEREGIALFNWNFDAKGKFLGTQFIGMTPAPLK